MKIELPSNWDSLMAELGYKPLESSYVKTDKKSAEVKTKKGKRPSAEKYMKMKKTQKGERQL